MIIQSFSKGPPNVTAVSIIKTIKIAKICYEEETAVSSASV